MYVSLTSYKSTCSRRMRCSSRSKGPSNTGVWTSYGTAAKGTGAPIRARACPPAPYDPAMARVFSGMQPTGEPTLGSLLGALRNWVADQNPDAFYCVVDLHALTMPQDPVQLRQQTLELATLFLAVGLDPEICTLFVQSHVHEHTELTWLLEC